MSEDIYQREGYADREEYLRDLAAEYDVDYENVLFLAEILGEDEDFDGLVSYVRDFSNIGLI